MIVKDHMVSQESFAISECENCRLRFTNPRPKSDELSKYYESEAYISHSGKSYGLISPIYKLVRQYAIRNKVGLINKYAHKKARLLDIGCGTGSFLSAAAKNGWEATGVEVNNEARSIAQKESNANIYPSIFDLPAKSKYEVITMWHVLEHVYNLEDTLKRIKELLITKGVLILALPNSNSADANMYREYWAGYDVPRHLYHFTQPSVKFLSKEYKLKFKEIYPMVFDSYYVSLLSEKYLTGKSGYWKAVKNGFNSNRHAKKTQEYSSLIYILKK
ncbi:MAG: class I SAM-dependent methyltransferase [Cyclobacteriaceae bacterium]